MRLLAVIFLKNTVCTLPETLVCQQDGLPGRRSVFMEGITWITAQAAM
jgi:hypothetical protein